MLYRSAEPPATESDKLTLMSRFASPFCLTHSEGTTTLTTGTILRSRFLDDVPRPNTELPVISMVPYCQIRERGYAVHDDGEPIVSLVPEASVSVELDHLLPEHAPRFSVGPVSYAVTDDEFAAMVASVVREEICKGEGSNFLLSRKGTTHIGGFSPDVAVEIFRRLVRNEAGAYLVFCFSDGDRFFIGASPERHITIRDDKVMMNPISGTLPKHDLRTKADLVAFLRDAKEVNELFQVVDEELKMMAKICPEGGAIRGPFLKEMSSLIHTEYVLEGKPSGDVRTAFRNSMFAATMIGSPLENAARVIQKYEVSSRRYYSSAILLHGREQNGREYIDSAITIRTMEIDSSGSVLLQSGASIVRDSSPEKETREVKAKLAVLLSGLHSSDAVEPCLSRFVDEEVQAVLMERNTDLSSFWMRQQESHDQPLPKEQSKSVLIIDNEDEFTAMIGHMLNHLGYQTSIRRYNANDILSGSHDIVVVGPGPGDPNDASDQKMQAIGSIVDALLSSSTPFLAVCLGHQILSRRLGLDVTPIDPPLQGVQREVNLFGTREKVGFYNTFLAQPSNVLPSTVNAALDEDGNVVALQGPRFRSFQCHLESVLSRNGEHILRDAMKSLLQ